MAKHLLHMHIVHLGDYLPNIFTLHAVWYASVQCDCINVQGHACNSFNFAFSLFGTG